MSEPLSKVEAEYEKAMKEEDHFRLSYVAQEKEDSQLSAAAAVAREYTMPTDIDDLTEQMSPERISEIKIKWSSAKKPCFLSYAYNSFLYDEDDNKMIKRFSEFVQLIGRVDIDGFFVFCDDFIKECSRRKEIYTASQCHLVYVILSSILQEISIESSKLLRSLDFRLLEDRKKIEIQQKFRRLSSERILSLFVKLLDLQISKTNYPDDISRYRDENEFLLKVNEISDLFDYENILDRLSLDSLKKIRVLVLQYNEFIRKYSITKDKREGEDDLIFDFRCKTIDKLQSFIERLNNSCFAYILNKKIALKKRSQSEMSKNGSEWLPKQLLEDAKTRGHSQKRTGEKQKGKKQKEFQHPRVLEASAPSVSAVQQDDSGEEEGQLLSAPARINVYDEREILTTSAAKKVDDTRAVVPLPQSTAPSASMTPIYAGKQKLEEFPILEYNKTVSVRADFALLFDELTYSQSQLLMKWQSQSEECSDKQCMANPHSKVSCFHNLRQRVQHYYNTRRFFESLKRKLSRDEQVHHRSHHVTSSSNLSLTNLLPLTSNFHRQIESIINKCLMTQIFFSSYLNFLRQERLIGNQDICECNKISVEQLGIGMEELMKVFIQYCNCLQTAHLAKISPDGSHVIIRPISDRYKLEIPGHVVISDTIDYFIHACQHVKDFPYKIVLENPREPVQPSKLFVERIRDDTRSEVYSRIY